jgi:hypothetical protein
MKKLCLIVILIFSILVIIAYVGHRYSHFIGINDLNNLLLILFVVNIFLELIFLSLSQSRFLDQIDELRKKRSALQADVRNLSRQQDIISMLNDRLDLFKQRELIKNDILKTIKSQKHLYMLLENYEKIDEDVYYVYDKTDRLITVLKRLIDTDKYTKKSLKKRDVPLDERAMTSLAKLFDKIL